MKKMILMFMCFAKYLSVAFIGACIVAFIEYGVSNMAVTALILASVNFLLYRHESIKLAKDIKGETEEAQ